MFTTPAARLGLGFASSSTPLPLSAAPTPSERLTAQRRALERIAATDTPLFVHPTPAVRRRP